VEIITRKIAGVKIPIMGKIDYDIKPFFMFSAPIWYLDGVEILKSISELRIERKFYLRKMKILDTIRKKTTQKVNLYEKVQIPSFEDAIRKIKRFLEDEENLSKSGQKILKNRMQNEAVL
jgi:V/A-type H+-transporting ATPase subunit D